MAASTALLTVEEYLALPWPGDDIAARRELIDGEIVPMPPPTDIHDHVKNVICRILIRWLDRNSTGEVFVEKAYRMEERHALTLDVSVIRKERLAKPTGKVTAGAPDIAIEVVSSEAADRLKKKVGIYLRNGAASVWLVYPADRSVLIYSATVPVRELTGDEAIEQPDVLPGFSTPVSAFFAGL
jgi:Uma2 family endonuclease